jgi:peptidoglycan-N-acetylglucosamine deacetylase
MFNYRSASITAYCVLATLIGLNLFYDIGFIPYIILVLLCSGAIFYGSAFVSSDFYFKIACSVKTDEKIIALTFDDGPTSETNGVLDVLKEYQVSAAFFVVGRRVEKNEDVVRRIHEEGHLIGNHSFSHDYGFSMYSKKRIIKELVKTEDVTEKIIGKRMNVFRPPYGVTNPEIQRAVKHMDCVPVGWSLKSKDTVTDRADKIGARLIKKVKPGDVILMHDTMPRVAVALKEFLEFTRKEGYKVVRLDELLSIEGYRK